MKYDNSPTVMIQNFFQDPRLAMLEKNDAGQDVSWEWFYLLALQNNNTFRSTSFMVYTHYYPFQVQRLQDWWLANKKTHFSLSIGFIFIRMRILVSWNFKILCIWNKSSAYIKKSKRSVVLYRRESACWEILRIVHK